MFSRRYRYVREQMPGGIRIRLASVPAVGPQAAQFYLETHRITEQLFLNGHPGGGADSICTAQFGAVLFQSSNQDLNIERARAVTAVWRNWASRDTECTCRIAAVLPDGSIYCGGIDDCPVHGFGTP